MAGKLRISKKVVETAMNSEPVQKALRERADKIKAKAQRIAAGAPDLRGTTVWVEDGTRPKGRPFSSVYCDNPDQEYGTARTARHRLLGRAAGVEK